ncbi:MULTISPECIES: hypothetical protein [unclassified Shewanella]|uniref:hypothetical protein n=1 Tax=unclassified Shewanella TaxID=196818 RepID=UPI001BB91B1B|nr:MULTISPECIES: hypothetical protein [unclassified Shewanella]GIU09565.1 hypothetical protein TUM4444_12400 [Shewanella sp. MBTL60-112-B1]GIU34058.1 hypothetical protein TUM4445_22220 [Shewanella sp. MBTL60-112-B2]
MKNKNEKFMSSHFVLLSIIAVFISACGGGGDDAADTPAPIQTPTETTTSTDTTTTTTTTDDPAPDPTSLDDLVVDADNKLESAYLLTIDVDRVSTERGYFSLCDDYQAQGDGYSVNFNSCLFRGPLTQGKLSKEVKVANHESQLIAVIWFYEGQAPQFIEWSYLQDVESQVLTMN